MCVHYVNVLIKMVKLSKCEYTLQTTSKLEDESYLIHGVDLCGGVKVAAHGSLLYPVHQYPLT